MSSKRRGRQAATNLCTYEITKQFTYVWKKSSYCIIINSQLITFFLLKAFSSNRVVQKDAQRRCKNWRYWPNLFEANLQEIAHRFWYKKIPILIKTTFFSHTCTYIEFCYLRCKSCLKLTYFMIKDKMIEKYINKSKNEKCKQQHYEGELKKTKCSIKCHFRYIWSKCW